VELILTKYPALKSIRDLGSLLQNPWKPKWIPLLGTKVSLDDIEHGLLRERGRYDDPTELFIRDRAMQVAIVAFGVLSVIALAWSHLAG